MPNNGMIIQLETSDIIIAKENVDDEGIIHIPDMIWNHIIREVEVQGQDFFNSLYIDVNNVDLVTPSEVKIESDKTVSYNSNGQYNIVPSSGYDALRSVSVDVNVPLPSIREVKNEFIDTNGTYEITAGGSWDALEKAVVTVNVPQPTLEELRVVSTPFNANGEYYINPHSGFEAMKQAKFTVNVPTGSQTNVETNKSVSYAMNGDFTIVPSTGYDAIGSVSVSVDVPSDINNQEKTLEPTMNNTFYIVEPDAGYTGLSKVTVRPHITPVLEDREYTITKNGQQTIYAQSGYEGMSSCRVITSIHPKLEERTVSITSNGITEITPQGLAVEGISKVTINTNVPTGTTSVPKATKIRYNATEYYISAFSHATHAITGFNVAPGNALILIKAETERYAIYTYKNKSTNTDNITINIAEGEYYMNFLDYDAVFYFIDSDGKRFFGTNDNDTDLNFSSVFIYKNICTLDF